MKALSSLLLLFCLAACATRFSNLVAVGRREAVRLRESHARWLAESPRKLDIMDVPSDSLSQEARAAGFGGGSVDSQTVLLFTAEREGLIFGRPSTAELDGLTSEGFTIETTPERDVRRFRFTKTKEANPATLSNDESRPPIQPAVPTPPTVANHVDATTMAVSLRFDPRHASWHRPDREYAVYDSVLVPVVDFDLIRKIKVGMTFEEVKKLTGCDPVDYYIHPDYAIFATEIAGHHYEVALLHRHSRTVEDISFRRGPWKD